VTDYPDWTVPQAHANAIAATGTPLLSLPNQLISTTTVINAGAFPVLPAVSITQPSYEISISANASGAGAAGPLEIDVLWQDAASLATLGEETWWIWPATAVTTHVITGRGPVKGSRLVIGFSNTSAVMQYTVVTTCYARSHLYLRDDWRTSSLNGTVAANPLAGNDLKAGMIGNRSVVGLAAGASDITVLPLYNGRAQLYADTSSSTSDMLITIQDSADPNAEGLGTRRLRYASNSAGLLAAEIALPRYQCQVSLTNNNAAAKNLFYSLSTFEA
jgi:hypothetical protein